jgi:hypothetical protein
MSDKSMRVKVAATEFKRYGTAFVSAQRRCSCLGGVQLGPFEVHFHEVDHLDLKPPLRLRQSRLSALRSVWHYISRKSIFARVKEAI